MINYTNATTDDLFKILELGYKSGIEYPIEGYKVDQAKWTEHIIAWLRSSLQGECFFELAWKDDTLLGYVIGVPTMWHYSDDIYLELKETLVDEEQPQKIKAIVVKKLAEHAEHAAREGGLKGVSAFSIRPNSTSFANFLCNHLGWTPAAGAKKIF